MSYPKLTSTYISDSFGWSTVAKARALHKEGAVLDWSFDISATKVKGRVVQKSRANPYQVELNLYQQNDEGEVYITGRCNCPQEYNCVHAGAVALMLLEDVDELGETPLDTAGLLLAEPLERQAVLKAFEDHTSVTAGWLSRLHSANSSERSGVAKEIVVYVFDVSRTAHTMTVEPFIARILKTGEPGSMRGYNWRQLASGRAGYIQSSDRSIAKLWIACSPCDFWAHTAASGLLLPPDDADVLRLVLERVVNTGRAYWKNKLDAPLQLGPELEGTIEWVLGNDARQAPDVVLDCKETEVIHAAAPWYVNLTKRQLGPIVLPFPQEICRTLLAAPRIAPGEVTKVCTSLMQINAELPLPQTEISEELRSEAPIACLVLKYINYKNKVLTRSDDTESKFIEAENAAVLSFDYGFDDTQLADSWSSYRYSDGKKSIIVNRDLQFEIAAARWLEQRNLVKTGHVRSLNNQSSWVARRHDTRTWLSFATQDLPELRHQGWRITFDPSFRFKVVEADSDDWHLQLEETGNGWFSLELGIDVDGEKIALLPVLINAIGTASGDTSLSSVESLNRDGKFYAQITGGKLLALPFERVKAILSCLAELLSKNALAADGRLAVSILQVVSLLNEQKLGALKWQGGNNLRLLAEKVRAFDRLAGAMDEAPDGFRATLRPYQREGLGWIDFIADAELGGILADDMGLGKTVQVLAHISKCKQKDGLAHPFLIVCPTSVVPNWLAEAQRLAPELKVLCLHGSERAARFHKISESDVVVTTYPLLARDESELTPRHWQAIVLDEAQAIKNCNTKTAHLVLQLQAQYRLCLTGTPIENHLGELWSQFNFLMPGLLGTRQAFEKLFQIPIEERRDDHRLAALNARIKPFLLRRTKEQVAHELPDKTVMIKYIELEGEQRDLYETVRLSMHEHVLAEVKKKGLASSQLVILDALMKVRQVCCDPRLVKLPAAASVNTSAKLQYLIELVEELIEEKRKILLFSQFTSMLDLIKSELDARGISFVELRGDTKDRGTPVNTFQNSDVPLFLISLKAGGTGLNLTAADTVIHYDPWWNPAVEDQATDRAHRIGQDKAVFVYRLVARGTIEQLMLDLQERKRSIADSVLEPSGAAGGNMRFELPDLAEIFAPCPSSSY